MNKLWLNRYPKTTQLALCLVAVLAVAGACYAGSAYIHYRVVAFVLLLMLSLIAVLFDIVPVLISGLVTALVWDYFFIPPHFTLQVGDVEDRILLLMYFVVATVGSVLTYKIRRMEQAAQAEENREHTIRLYNTLLNSLSHELRTPLATIIGATDNLQHHNARLTESHRHDLLSEISKATLRLNRQVENLLNMSRLESGVIRPKPDWCDISELVYGLVRKIEDDGVRRDIDISIPPGLPLFRLDCGMLEQVVANLLGNAVNYTPAGSAIGIAVQCYADLLEIVVEDGGPGFPKDETGQVFDKFYRLRNTSAGGTGLGLSIVRGFTEAMGGSVELENAPTGGARFAVRIAAQTSYLKNLKHE